MAGIYLRDGDKLIAMVETPYETEDVLQALLEEYPELLAGDERAEEPRRWLLIEREISLASDEMSGGRWSVDHLFVDQTGVPTIVEVKRRSDTRIRREVVGQMLDYAANAVVYWNLDHLRATFESGCAQRGQDPVEVVAQMLDVEDTEAFWEGVRTNLAANRLRLVFVADEIPSELRRIVEYLNEQMSTTEVLAIEIKQYVDADARHQTLVPRLVGQTEAAKRAKGRTPGRHWNRDTVLDELAVKRGRREVDVARAIVEWAEKRGDLRFFFGSGQKDGSVQAGLDDGTAYLFPFALYTYGHVEVQFQFIRRKPPFDAVELRRELLAKLNVIPGVELADDALDKRPRIPLDLLANDDNLDVFLSAMEWAFAQAKARIGA